MEMIEKDWFAERSLALEKIDSMLRKPKADDKKGGKLPLPKGGSQCFSGRQ